MTRSYLVIPQGTAAYVVQASRPKHAANKAQRAKGEPVELDALVIPLTRTSMPQRLSASIPGQLSLDLHTPVG